MSTKHTFTLFVSARGIKSRPDRGTITFEEWDPDLDALPRSVTDDAMRAALNYESVEVQTIVDGEQVTLMKKELKDITAFIHLGEIEFLGQLNKAEFRELCDEIIRLKTKVVATRSGDMGDQDRIGKLRLQMIKEYELLQRRFVGWFDLNHFELPTIPTLKGSLQDTFEDIRNNLKDVSLMHISEFDALEITIPRITSYSDKISVALSKAARKSKAAKLSRYEASLLWFLAEERKNSGENWLAYQEKHRKLLLEISNTLELGLAFEKEVLEKPPKPETWIWKGTSRKSAAHRINDKFRHFLSIEGSLIVIVRRAHPARKAIYSLHKAIGHVSISKPK